ncbi:MAG: heme biosynthesis HemY N-terminal domain-containing protein [Betaproteobacteria bacterium]|jgi:HemY protein|nr:heme biosynthesis protein HemY [Rubrivivax sp.]
MRGVIWLLLLAVVAVVAASLLGPNDGLVSVYWGGWRTDLSLNLAVLLLVGLGAALLLGVQALNSLVSLPRRAGQWRALRRERAAEAALREAQAEYFAGRYGRAQKAAQRALVLQTDAEALAGDARFRLLARLLAAGSLHRLQDRRRRDAMVDRALAERPGTAATGGVAGDDATRLLAAEWALDDRDAGRALEMLDALPPGAARRTQALRLRLQAARLARQPAEALRTARLLANHQAFSPLVAQTLLRSLAGEVLETAHDLQQLRRLWNQLDAGDRRDAQVAARAAQRAALLGGADDARQWLRPFWDRLAELSREDRDSVALALADARSGIGNDWLPRLELAAQSYGHEPAVVAAVGLALAERRLWGKARTLLEQAAASAALVPALRRRAWRVLAEMARSEGDEARAQGHERSAASLD